MQTRQLGIIAIAAIVAFGAAFGVGKVTNKSEAAAPSGGGAVKALVVADAPSVGSISTSAAPALKAIKAKAKPKPKVTTKPAADNPVAKNPVTKNPVVKPPVIDPGLLKRTPTKPKPKPKPEPVDRGGGED